MNLHVFIKKKYVFDFKHACKLDFRIWHKGKCEITHEENDGVLTPTLNRIERE